MDESDIRIELKRSLKRLGWWAYHAPDFAPLTGEAGSTDGSKPDLMCFTQPTKLVSGKACFIEVKKAIIEFGTKRTMLPITFSPKDIKESQRNFADNRVQEGWKHYLAVGTVTVGKQYKRIEREMLIIPWTVYYPFETEYLGGDLDKRGTIPWTIIKENFGERYFWQWKGGEFGFEPIEPKAKEYFTNTPFSMEKYNNLSLRRAMKNG